MPNDSHPQRVSEFQPTHFAKTRKERVTLLGSLGAGYVGLYMTMAALVGVMLQQQLAVLDPENKAWNLALCTSLSAAATIVVQPLIGVVSDRTRSKLGRRAPYILIGGIGGGLCTIAMQFATSLFLIVLSWVLIQMLLNTVQGPLSTTLSDRLSPRDRGIGSAMTGIGASIGGTVGISIAGFLLNRIGIAYTLFGCIVIVVCVLFVVLNPDQPSTSMPRDGMDWKGLLGNFLVDPRRHPDFGWAFLARFFMVLGYTAVTNYQLYILTDYIRLDTAQAGMMVSTLSIVNMVTTSIAMIVGGRLSDRLGHRKVFVAVAAVLIAIGIAMPLIMPSVAGMYCYGVVYGLGFGMFNSVDMALMVDVLPSRDDAAKDLGILNIAGNVPQSLTPIAAAALLGATANDYRVLFIYGIIAVLVSAVCVLPIKGAH